MAASQRRRPCLPISATSRCSSVMPCLPRRLCAPAHPKRGKFMFSSEVVSTRSSNSSQNLQAELEREGAVRVRVGSKSLLEIPGFDPFPQRDPGFDYLCMTRPLVEFVVRRSVERQCNVALKSRCRVTQFLESPNRAAVTGVRYHEADGQTNELAADFVVDASSRGALTVEMLDKDWPAEAPRDGNRYRPALRDRSIRDSNFCAT